MDNYINNCAICGKPILGYWYALGKNNICQSCGASVTVYDLFMRDLVDIKPDIIDSDLTLVTKDFDSPKQVISSEYGMVGDADDSPKQVISSEYGMVGDATLVTKDDDCNYTEGYLAAAQKIISDIKFHGFNTEREFFEGCQNLYDAGITGDEHPLLLLREQYNEVMSSLRYGANTGKVKWDIVNNLWA